MLVTVLSNMKLGKLYDRIANGTPKIGQARRDELRAAGVQIVKPGKGKEASYRLPDIPGTPANESLFTNTNAKVIAYYKAWVRAGKPSLRTPDLNPPPPSTGGGGLPIAIPGGATVADVLGKVPGFGSIATRLLGMSVAGLLLWPTAAGKGSDLRDFWAHNRPKTATPGGRTRGRRGARAKPRRGRRPRAVSPPKVPVTWPGRGGPVTIRRGGRAVPAPPATATVKLPQPSGVLGPGWARDTAGEPFTTPGSYGVPAKPTATSSRATSSSTATSSRTATSSPPSMRTPPIAAPTVATPAVGLPTMPGNWTDWLSLFQPGTQPKPKVRPSPAPALAPLTQPNAAAVPYASPLTQTRECSCAKPKRKRRNECRNPVTKRKRETRGGHKFVTITKRLDCERGKNP